MIFTSVIRRSAIVLAVASCAATVVLTSIPNANKKVQLATESIAPNNLEENPMVGHLTGRLLDNIDATDLASYGITFGRSYPNNIRALILPERMPFTDAMKLSGNLQRDGIVEFADAMLPLVLDDAQVITCSGASTGQVSTDSCAAEQDWYLDEIGAATAWADYNASVADVVVAVLDTGSTPHEDVASQWVAGRDMIGESWAAVEGSNNSVDYYNPDGLTSAVDGDGRDGNATDEGIGRALGDCTLPTWTHKAGGEAWRIQAPAATSTWHGTAVGSIIAANRDNAKGIAGIAKGVKLQPVRVIGRCIESDNFDNLPDGIRWAAKTLTDNGSLNTQNVKVINMSLGSLVPVGYENYCPTVYTDAINEALAAGISVVASVGNNSGAPASRHIPSNCPGVISVGATTTTSELASYSNIGADLSAPGGRTNVLYANGILVANNSGTTTAVADTYKFGQGTSYAAPMVTAAIAMALNKYSTRNLTPANIKSALIHSATSALPGSKQCVGCGAGILNIPNFLSVLDANYVSSAPTGVTAERTRWRLNQGSASWTAPISDAWSPLASFTARAYSDEAMANLASTCTAVSSATTCTFEDLAPDTTYYVKVTASSATVNKSTTVGVPFTTNRRAPAPTIDSVVPGPGKATVTWTSPVYTDADNAYLNLFNVAAFDVETGGTIKDSCVGNTTCDLERLTPGIAYWVEASVISGNGWDPLSSARTRVVATALPEVATTVPAVTTTVPAAAPVATTVPASGSNSTATTVPSTSTGSTTVTTTPPSSAVSSGATVSSAVASGKTASKTTLLALAKVKVPAGAKYAIKVAGASSKFCKVSGTGVKALKAGSCKVTVTVTPKKGKATAKTVTLKILK